MLTEKDYCDYETSRELKELGFVAGLGEDDCGHCLYDDAWHDQVDRPLLYEAQKWLREERLLFIEIDKILYGGYKFHVLDFTTYTEESCGYTDGYEDAISEGIKAAVKILKEDETIHR